MLSCLAKFSSFAEITAYAKRIEILKKIEA